MIVICLIGIGICILVLCSSDGNKAADEGDTMTNAQLAEMIRENEKDRRRERFEAGLTSAQHGTRIPTKRYGQVKGNKGNSRARGWDNI